MAAPDFEPAPRVSLRPVVRADRREFLELMRTSERFHDPWISPPRSPLAFDHYLARLSRDDHDGQLICLKRSSQIVGVVNLNNIVRGSFLSASLGYYVGAPYARQGYMLEGLELIKRYAIHDLGLHRLEANIQPDNAPSIGLAQRAGFSYEGLSPAYLYIDGAWRDHERWTYTDSRRTLLPQQAR
ncbi:MAG: GNAT family protein [Pseudomonadota bacterium]